MSLLSQCEFTRIANGKLVNRPIGPGDYKPCTIAFFENQTVGVDKGNGDTKRYDSRQLKPMSLAEDILLKMGFVNPAGNGMSFRISVNASDELCWYKQLGRLMYQQKIADSREILISSSSTNSKTYILPLLAKSLQ
ncbi:MAG TPA: hypothetical protein VGB63_02705 [Pedobacter sp.]|jgi:hypothetical protein